MFLGIDTSCYTTSLAVVDENGNLVEDKRIVLPVAQGQKGLQQSTALFYHLENLPLLLEQICKNVKGRELRAIAASQKPCPREDSYMPVFRAGFTLGQNLAAVLDIPLIKSTHQEGHLAAGLWSARADLASFLALHLSGGTTELLLVERKNNKPLRYEVQVIGRALDIPAGQLVDRVGVAMGLPFPAGPALEQVAAQQDEKSSGENKPEQLIIPSAVKGYDMSFSGAETQAKKYLSEKCFPQEIARAVEKCIATTLEKVTRKAVKETGIKDVLVVGGVASNNYIRRRLQRRLEHRAVGARLYFPEGCYSRDNAVGISVIARSGIISK